MKTITCFLAIACAILLTLRKDTLAQCGNNKVLICHIPPGNPSNAHSICVSPNAVPAHLAHGDVLGDCSGCVCPGPNPANVTLCHVPPGNPGNAHTITVSSNAVPAHLAHGDYLGSCVCSCPNNIGTITVSPNPVSNRSTITFVIPNDNQVSVEVFDMTGKRIALLFQSRVIENTPYSVDYSALDMPEGIYIVRLTEENGSIVNSKMILVKD